MAVIKWPIFVIPIYPYACLIVGGVDGEIWRSESVSSIDSAISQAAPAIQTLILPEPDTIQLGYVVKPLACIYMDLRNACFLIIASGHHREREINRQKFEPLVNCIFCLSPANQNAYHKHWIVFSAYRVGVALHCAMQIHAHSALHNVVSNDDLYYIMQCILDCLPVYVSTEAVHSDDQWGSPPTSVNLLILLRWKSKYSY